MGVIVDKHNIWVAGQRALALPEGERMEVRSQLSTNPRYNNDRRASQRTKNGATVFEFLTNYYETMHQAWYPVTLHASSKSKSIVLTETVWQKTRRGEEK